MSPDYSLPFRIGKKKLRDWIICHNENMNTSLEKPVMNETEVANVSLSLSPFIEELLEKQYDYFTSTLQPGLNIPPHPVKPVLQRGGNVKVNIKMLQCNTTQIQQIEDIYNDKKQFCRLFETTETDQHDAQRILEEHGLEIRCLEDLGNGWSKRWSKDNNLKPGTAQRILMQCQCGSSTTARQEKSNVKKKASGLEISPKKWTRKTPYDFTGCLAHLDITFVLKDSVVQRIMGIIEYNEACIAQDMKRFPAVPLHPHVWQIALEQLNEGASYHGHATKDERFKICLHTQEMQDAAWKYAHKGQLLLDGTFGICNSWVLLFIAMAIDEDQKGLPIAFFLFSAPSGNRATHSGYNIEILTELFSLWKTALGKKNNETFCPKVAITDTDTKERGALLACWSNKCKVLLNIGKKYNFEKIQIETRLRALEENLIKTITYEKAVELIQNEHTALTGLSQGTGCNPKAIQGSAFLTYLTDTWMPNSLWQGWSLGGWIKASKILNIDIDGVIPTTNHLEAFNGVLKTKYLNQAKHHGRRLHLDLLFFGIQGSSRAQFRDQAGGANLRREKKINPIMEKSTPVAWWNADAESIHQEAAAEIVRLCRIGNYKWLDPYTLSATCAHTVADTRQPDYQYYDLKISGYGWAYCGCPYFLGTKGACKHLWALRSILKTQSLPFVITYPATQIEALKIASYFLLKGTISSVPTPPLPLNNLKNISEEIFTTIHSMGGASEEIKDNIDSDSGSSDNDENDDDHLQDINVKVEVQMIQIFPTPYKYV
ncbi:hypothetical protein Clacol_004599 [Clathrus columnatus]|uniref:SWIM-type domain-containing protein n=1 Tax=Clathrus columnatus TaxID=1419009 RepID=A0AAV5AB21_9AGAM|nr:hypothetical protein Clacol_004599 [Clathrus columnatus]